VVAFVIPFKPKRNSQNWQLDSLYLSNTINALLLQTNSFFKIFVVQHDLPSLPVRNSKVVYLTFPKDYCEYPSIQDGPEQLKGNSYLKEKDVEYLFDQGRKQMYGASIAAENNFDYVMCVDGDDIISKNLVNYVLQNEQGTNIGWFVNKGYFFIKEKNIYLRRSNGMNLYNGSTHIVRKNYIPPFDINDLRFCSVNFFASHAYLVTRLKYQFNQTLKPLPFYATIYVVTTENWRISSEFLKGQTFIQNIKYLLKKVLFTKQIKKEFNVL
jgi:hypothetical protein